MYFRGCLNLHNGFKCNEVCAIFLQREVTVVCHLQCRSLVISHSFGMDGNGRIFLQFTHDLWTLNTFFCHKFQICIISTLKYSSKDKILVVIECGGLGFWLPLLVTLVESVSNMKPFCPLFTSVHLCEWDMKAYSKSSCFTTSLLLKVTSTFPQSCFHPHVFS